ncbi:MAG: HI0074 family nucleotidyltransferase substrate-binding subunit [Gammaproteobacteria bacterium]
MNDQVKKSFDRLEKAIIALQVMVVKPMEADRSNIDATIQRFEFTIELYWKLLKRLLEEKGVIVQYPRDVLREAYAGRLIDDEAIWLNMLKDRNLSSHTYNEELLMKFMGISNNIFPLSKKRLNA